MGYKTKTLQLLISAGADVNTSDNDVRTKLIKALWVGDTEIVQLLRTH